MREIEREKRERNRERRERAREGSGGEEERRRGGEEERREGEGVGGRFFGTCWYSCGVGSRSSSLTQLLGLRAEAVVGTTAGIR